MSLTVGNIITLFIGFTVIIGAAFTGQMMVLDSKIESGLVPIKLEIAQLPYKIDSSLQKKIKPLERIFSLSDAEVMTNRIVNSGIIDLKLYTDNKFNLIEKSFKLNEENKWARLDTLYVIKNWDTTEMWLYRIIDNGKMLIYEKQPLTEEEFINLNN